MRLQYNMLEMIAQRTIECACISSGKKNYGMSGIICPHHMPISSSFYHFEIP